MPFATHRFQQKRCKLPKNAVVFGFWHPWIKNPNDTPWYLGENLAGSYETCTENKVGHCRLLDKIC